MKPAYFFFVSLFVFLLLAPTFSSATIATFYGNSSNCFSTRGTQSDLVAADHMSRPPNGTAFTAGQNASIGAVDMNVVVPTGGSGSLNTYIITNCTLPANSAISWINFTIRGNGTTDALHLAVFNYSSNNWFDVAIVAAGTAQTTRSFNFTTGLNISHILKPADNRTVNMFPHASGTTSGSISVDVNMITVSYSPPPDTPPQYSNNATNMQSPMLYETTNNHGFQIDWTDNVAVFNATFQLGRPSGTLTNYTNSSGSSPAVRLTGSTYHINFTQDQFGPVGTYNYTWYANDTSNNWNKSDTVNHVINKAATNMSLRLNGTENNNTYVQNQVANFTARLNVSGKTIFLNSNYTGWVMQSGVTTIFNYTTLLTAGSFFNITANWTGDENYTGNQKDYLFNVTLPGTPISACGNLNAANTVYILTANVSSANYCFHIIANNVTLDGSGYQINYSQSATGYAINNTGGYDNITIKNLNIVQGSTSSNSFAIYGRNMANSTISNNNVTTKGTGGIGIDLTLSDSNNVSGNNIRTFGTSSQGILVNVSNLNTLTDNIVNTTGITQASAVYIWSSNNTSVTGGSYISSESPDYYSKDAGGTNNFMNTNFTASRNLYFSDTTSWFNYNNVTGGGIWLKTSISKAAAITRTLVNWNSTLMQWNDTNNTATTTAYYNITGLLANSVYTIYNASG